MKITKILLIQILFLFTILFMTSCKKDIPENLPLETKVTNKSILTLGDSLTSGYGLDLDDSYPGQLETLLREKGYSYQVVNAGVSGDTSIQLFQRINLYIEDDDDLPDIAILVIGGNDGLRGKSISELEKNITKIIKRLKDKNIQIILGAMKIPPNLGINYSRDFFDLYSKLAKEENVYLINFFLEGVAGNRKYNQNDGIHPNKQGNEIISKNILEFLESNSLIHHD